MEIKHENGFTRLDTKIEREMDMHECSDLKKLSEDFERSAMIGPTGNWKHAGEIRNKAIIWSSYEQGDCISVYVEGTDAIATNKAREIYNFLSCR